MRFPILFKHKRVFVWYAGHWINIHLSASTHGSGIKGYCRFFSGWIKCIFGSHKYIRVFRLYEGSEIECEYCRKEK